MTGYVKTGNFTNGAAPGISAAFLNNLESFVAYASDSLITTDGSGNLYANTFHATNTVYMLTASLTSGSMTRISKFTGAAIMGKVTKAHALGAIPDIVMICFNLTGTPSAATIGVDYTTLTTANCDVWSSIAANYVGLAIKF